MRYQLVDAERVGHDLILSVQRRFLWFKPNLTKYRGSGTVWHTHPEGKRCPTDLEMILSRYWTRWKWENGA